MPIKISSLRGHRMVFLEGAVCWPFHDRFVSVSLGLLEVEYRELFSRAMRRIRSPAQRVGNEKLLTIVFDLPFLKFAERRRKKKRRMTGLQSYHG